VLSDVNFSARGAKKTDNSDFGRRQLTTCGEVGSARGGVMARLGCGLGCASWESAGPPGIV
jgi:hypothetical protein